MRNIVYYVAVSIDGYIAGTGDDVSSFVQQGDAVNQYLKDLEQLDTLLMGRKTYEFGYKYGLEPGQPAYPHMNHYIFSNRLHFSNQHSKVHVCSMDLKMIEEIKLGKGSDIYLCGGGKFAGWLLENKMIDYVKIKLNPLILGEGVPLFGSSQAQHQLQLIDHQNFDDGVQILKYKIIYE